MCTHVCKCKNEISSGMEGGRRMVEEVNACMMCFIHCKNLCKGHNVAPPSQQ
jgi:hypothetical protein